MPIISITSDWGLKDHYLAAVKGSILTYIPDATIVDISHDIPSFDLNQTSFVIRNSYEYFPKGSIHIIGVKSDASIKTPHTAVLFDGHYFLGADNGVFSLIFNRDPEKIVEIDIIQDTDSFTFSTRDVFVRAAAHIAKGEPLENLGIVKDSLMQKMSFAPVVEKNAIKGKVIYVDTYENVITNITEPLFKELVGKKSFSIVFRTPGYLISSISKSYDDVPEGEMLALFSTGSHLEIAINLGKASSLLGLRIDDTVRIEF
ncbi:MAG: SAM-dependent chlorinase/fluorinase [Bacteroidales bacterium]|nr:SAM-dependent chlorinase/fluorinase [Bacteroidales bacterium]